MDGQYRVYGVVGSPYSMKMRAILRYRRLRYAFIPAIGGMGPISHVRPPVIPVIQFPDESWHVDSTPMIDELEALHPAQRSVVPDDPGRAFLAYVLEDFADEWMTKMMFHFRWSYEADSKAFAREGAFDFLGATGRSQIEAVAEQFTLRQVDRRAVVGCTDENRELIESTFDEVVRLLDGHVTERLFLFGSRPSRADFAVYGQLTQLVADPTPASRMRADGPYAFRWVRMVDDLCGLEGEWDPVDAPLAEVVTGLLHLSGEIYFPFLVANAEALARGDSEMSVTLRGQPFKQAPFKYQVRCLQQIRQRFSALDSETVERLSPTLRDAGLLDVLSRGEG